MLDKSNLPKFSPDMYKKIALNDLVIYSIHFFQRGGLEISSEDIISACFILFPKRFSMRNYPHWPDSAVVSRRWIECRIKGYIAGSAVEGFKITAKGIKFAERVSKKLGVAKPKPAQVIKKRALRKVIKTRIKQSNKKSAVGRKKTRPSVQTKKIVKKTPFIRTINRPAPVRPDKSGSLTTIPIRSGKVHRDIQVVKLQPKPKQAEKALPTPVVVPKDQKIRAGKFVHLMERSDAYLHYKKNGKNSKIGEFDFRSLLLCTMESSRETLVKNMGLFKGYASIHNRQDLIIFLNYCDDKFSYLLAAPQKQFKKSLRK
jgi:hypothetical protein